MPDVFYRASGQSQNLSYDTCIACAATRAKMMNTPGAGTCHSHIEDTDLCASTAA